MRFEEFVSLDNDETRIMDMETKDYVYNVVDMLNELNIIQEFLLKENLRIYDAVKTRAEIQHQLEDEVEELKCELGRLYNYFFKWFEEERGMNPESFSNMWNNIRKGEDNE